MSVYDWQTDLAPIPRPALTRATDDLFALVGMILHAFPPDEAVRILKRTFPYREAGVPSGEGMVALRRAWAAWERSGVGPEEAA